jgi:hypothetical protein
VPKPIAPSFLSSNPRPIFRCWGLFPPEILQLLFKVVPLFFLGLIMSRREFSVACNNLIAEIMPVMVSICNSFAAIISSFMLPFGLELAHFFKICRGGRRNG